MKSRCLLFILVCFSLSIRIYGGVPYCDNLSFERGDFTNWTGKVWIHDKNGIQSLFYQILPGRQTIMNDTTTYDINTGGNLKKVPPGYKFSAKLGDAVKGSLGESLSYTLLVDSTNALFIWKFAVVLQDPGHVADQQPRFNISLKDDKGNAISACSQYNVGAASNIPNFQTYYAPTSVTSTWNQAAPISNTIEWRDWTTVGANLLPYYGKKVTIEFTAEDCTPGGHFGYAYFVAECHPLQITVNYCKGDTAAILTAPDGFSSYKWTTGNASDTTQNLILYNPVEGAKYQCSFTSVMGCSATLESTIAKYLPVADFTSHMQDCDSNIVKFNNFSTSNKAPINYEWDFGDGTTSSDLSPQHKFTTSGSDQQVKLTVSNPPSSCKSILSKTIPLFARPLVGISGDSTYCRGETTTITAYGGYHYLWSNGDTVTTITTGSPSNYWVIGYSTTRDCQSKPILRQVLEEPDWQISIAGDTLFCTGDSTVVTASGAVKYLWDSGSSNNSITVSEGGNYTVEGENLKGCKRSNTVSVVKDALPLVDFTLSSNTINNKFNYVTFCIPQQQDVTYAWNFGDGSTDTQSCGNHYFALSGEVGMFLVTLTATNKNGCVNQSSKTVIVEPFIPNVFSPNSDGHNDLFMPNYEMQIFDRQGILIYQGTKNSKGWDGTFNGQKVDPDTYYYILQYTDYLQQQHTRKGYVTLVR